MWVILEVACKISVTQTHCPCGPIFIKADMAALKALTY